MFKSLFSKLKKSPITKYNKVILDANADISEAGVLKEVFGIRIYDGSIAPFSIIGDSYPAEGSYTFSTREDYQDQITLEFHRSSQQLASKESYLGTLRIRGYKLDKAEVPLVRVHYQISGNKIAVWATNEIEESLLTFTVAKNTYGQTVH